MRILAGLLGLAGFIGFAWCLSLDRRRFPWRQVAAGLLLQFVFAFLLLRTEAGRRVFSGVGKAFDRLLGFADRGVSMVFGPLADRGLLVEKLGTENAFIFVVTVTGTIVFISALSSMLYHYGILQAVVRAAAWGMRKVMGASGSESLAAAANIFMGQTEAPLVIKPYLDRMTRSELMALMVGGMSTIAGGVFAAYVSFGIDAGHLLAASVMSAPAALMMAKVMLPESEASETAAGAAAKIERLTHNGLDALCAGAGDGIKLAGNVMAMLIAFVATVALLNYLISLPLRLAGVNEAEPLQVFLGWVNAPFAWLMGVPWADCLPAGRILGERVVLNEFMAYLSLAREKPELDPRTAMLMTYALCGFANFSSIAIQMGGIGALVPGRRSEFSKLGLRAMIGGLLACYCTATVAGMLL